MGTIITRSEAIDLGLKKYFTGRPCKREHIAERSVATRACLVCSSEQRLAWDKTNPQRAREHATKWRKQNKVKSREWYGQWFLDNPEKHRMYSSERRARKLNATIGTDPRIAAMYLKALEWSSLLETPLQVDHIVPLCNPTVCGLHVWANLQLIDKETNQSKNNSFAAADHEYTRSTDGPYTTSQSNDSDKAQVV